MESASCSSGFSKLNRPAHGCLRPTLQETPRDVPCKTRGQDGFATSFPVGLLHPLQHAGLSRRSPVCRLYVQVDSTASLNTSRLLSTNARISQARSLSGIYLLRIYHHMIYCSGYVEPGGPPRRAPAASPRSFFRSFRFGRRRKARLSDHARRQNTLCGIRLDWTCNSLHYDPALGRACFSRGAGVSATHQTQNVQPYFSRNRLAQSGVPATG